MKPVKIYFEPINMNNDPYANTRPLAVEKDSFRTTVCDRNDNDHEVGITYWFQRDGKKMRITDSEDDLGFDFLGLSEQIREAIDERNLDYEVEFV